MKKIQYGFLALLSFSAALYVGLIDYETKSVWQLFNAENLPFMLFFSAAVFCLLNFAIWLIRTAVHKTAKLLS